MKNIFTAIKDEFRVIFGEEQKDTVYSSQRTYDETEALKKDFEESVRKLLDVNNWSSLPGISSKFELHDSQGKVKTRSCPDVGDFIKIVLPGPLPENWVAIIDKKMEENMVEFTVSPSFNPLENHKDRVEHFFIDEAISTFRVEKVGNRIIATEIGRNEGINNKGEDAGKREILNTLIAEGGWAGFQKVQWEKLTDYLVHKN